MGWANTQTDPLVFPPGTAGNTGGQIAIGTQLPANLALAANSAIVFYVGFGAYWALYQDATHSLRIAYSPDSNVATPLQVYEGFYPSSGIFPRIELSRNLAIPSASGAQIMPRTSFVQINPTGGGGAQFGGRFDDQAAHFATVAPCGYRIDADGWCHVAGDARVNVAGVNPFDPIIFGLPAPLPALDQEYPTICSDTLATVRNILRSDGQYQIISNSGAALVVGNSIPFSFRYYVGPTVGS